MKRSGAFIYVAANLNNAATNQALSALSGMANVANGGNNMAGHRGGRGGGGPNFGRGRGRGNFQTGRGQNGRGGRGGFRGRGQHGRGGFFHQNPNIGHPNQGNGGGQEGPAGNGQQGAEAPDHSQKRCHHCGKMGHIRRNCPDRPPDNGQNQYPRGGGGGGRGNGNGRGGPGYGRGKRNWPVSDDVNLADSPHVKAPRLENESDGEKDPDGEKGDGRESEVDEDALLSASQVGANSISTSFVRRTNKMTIDETLEMLRQRAEEKEKFEERLAVLGQGEKDQLLENAVKLASKLIGVGAARREETNEAMETV